MSTFTILKRDGHTTSPPNPHPLKKKKDKHQNSFSLGKLLQTASSNYKKDSIESPGKVKGNVNVLNICSELVVAYLGLEVQCCLADNCWILYLETFTKF